MKDSGIEWIGQIPENWEGYDHFGIDAQDESEHEQNRRAEIKIINE